MRLAVSCGASELLCLSSRASRDAGVEHNDVAFPSLNHSFVSVPLTLSAFYLGRVHGGISLPIATRVAKLLYAGE